MPQPLVVTYTGIIVVLLLGLCIFVHELGHFLAARLFGMVIDTFSIGFGPAIWKRKRGDTVYKIGIIPVGGYVALPQLDPTGMALIQGTEDGGREKDSVQCSVFSVERREQEGEEDRETGNAQRRSKDETKNQEPGTGSQQRALPPIAPWKKIVVSVAGVTGNVLLAVAIAWMVYWVGIPTTVAQRSAMVGHVDESTEAFQLGLRVGDTVVTANGEPVKSWQDVLVACALCDEIVLEVSAPDGTMKTLALATEKGAMGQQTLRGVYGLSRCLVQKVEEGASADLAGLKAGDLILEFNGIPIISGDQLIEAVDQHRDEQVPITIMRDGERMTMSVTPDYNKEEGRALIGVVFDPLAILRDEIQHPRPGEQIRHHASLILRVLKALVTPGQAGHAAKAVGGPVAVLDTYVRLVMSSFMLAVWFTGLLNVNLAIINMLPLPVLDGGHIVFALWEWVTGRPVRPSIVNALVNVFAVLLIAMFVLLSYRDIKRWAGPDSLVGRAMTRIERLVGLGSDD